MRRHHSRQSKTFIAQRRTRTIMRVLTAGGIVAGVLALVYAFASLGALTITTVQVAGADQDQAGKIHDLAMGSLEGQYLGIFSRSNAFIYPRASIRAAVLEAYPDIQSVSVSRSDRHTVVVEVDEKKPSALVCATLPDFNGNDISLDDSGDCYFTDKTGRLFKKAPSFSGSVYNRYYIPELSVDADDASSTLIGTFATSTQEFSSIQSIYETVQHNNIAVDAMLMKSAGEYELYVRNPGMSSSTAVVYFNTISSPDEQISNLISFWDHTVATARTKKESVAFDYIDVRYAPNVYHRFAH